MLNGAVLILTVKSYTLLKLEQCNIKQSFMPLLGQKSPKANTLSFLLLFTVTCSVEWKMGNKDPEHIIKKEGCAHIGSY